MKTKPEFSFPVVKGMVAVEHVRYLQQDRVKLADALKAICAELAEYQQVDKEHLTYELIDTLLAQANEALGESD